MTTATPTKKARKGGTPARKAATRPAGSSNGSTPAPSFVAAPPEEFVSTPVQEDDAPSAPEPVAAPAAAAAAPAAPAAPEHPYGATRVFSYSPKDGSAPIVFPHISTCIPDALFLYDNRNKDELRQCFSWMDRAGVPDEIGRRVWMLPAPEQAAVVSGWFSGLVVNGPEGVSPPGEY